MDTLLKDIEAFKNATAGKIPAETRAIMQRAGIEIGAKGAGKNAPRLGDFAPDFSLPDAMGKEIRLSQIFKTCSVVLIFYRGGWCPYCNLELRAYQRELDRFKKAGIEIIAISPEKPDHALTTKEKNNLGFEVLSDVKNDVARQYGLLFDLPPELIPIYQGFGVDLIRHNSVGAWILPVPGTFAITKGGIIKRALADVDYTNRLEPTDCLTSLSD